MPWITPTIDDLNDARAGELVAALRTEALASGQTDPMPRRIQTVVDEIRRCIAKWPSTPLDADTTKIPPGLRELAVEKIVRGLKARLMMAMTEDEVRAEALYQKRLEMLTRGEWPVDTPDTAIATPPVAPGGATQIVSAPCRIVTRDSLNGL